MNDLSRRVFLFASSGAAAGAFIVPGIAEAQEDLSVQSKSGLITGSPKPLRYNSIPGFLSAEQIAPHHTAHYEGLYGSRYEN